MEDRSNALRVTMLDALEANERQGPEAQRIPNHGEMNSVNQATNKEQPDAGDERENDKKPWAPYGFYWTTMRGQPVLQPTEAYINEIVKAADICYVNALHKYSSSNECRTIIEILGNEMKAVYTSRRAINDKAWDRLVKRDCDDAAYQIVQAAKYRIDAEELMRQNNEFGPTTKRNEKIEQLRNYAKTNQREGYILTGCVLKACEDEKLPTFDYKEAAKRTCRYSAERLTETLGARLKNEQKAKELEQKAFEEDMKNFWD